MIIDGKLSLSQQKTGRKIMLYFSFLNGIALTCITGNVLSLYLLNTNCNPPIIAAITSFCYLGTLFAFAGKFSISKIGAGATIKYSLLISALSAVLLSILPFFNFLNIQKSMFTVLLILSTFSFFVFKSIGTVALQPLMGEITDKDNRGDFSSKFFLFYLIATVLAIVSIFFLILFNSSLLMFQIIIFIGAMALICNAGALFRMKETNIPIISAHKKNTKLIFAAIFRNKDLRTFLLVRSFTRASIILIIPISILALVKMYNVSNQTALIFACIQLIGGIFITYFNGIISEETGPKPLLIIYLMVLYMVCLFWILAPEYFHWGYNAITFFLGGVCLFGIDSCLNHYYLTIIPRKSSVSISLWYTTICGVVAGVTGLFFGGGLIHLLAYFISYANLFRYYYLIMLILLIPLSFLISQLKSISSWKVHNILSLAVKPKKLQSLHALRNIHKYATPKDEVENVLKLQGMCTELSEESLIYYLKSPIFFIRFSAMRALNHRVIGKETKEAVFKELQKGPYSSAYLAAMILSKNHVQQAIPFLRQYLSSEDIHLRTNSMIGLAQLKDKESFNEIIELFRSSTNPMVVARGSVAFQIINDKFPGKYLNTVEYILQKSIHFNNKKHEYIVDQLKMSMAAIFGFYELYYKAFRIYHDNNYELGTLNVLEVTNKRKVASAPGSPVEELEHFLSKSSTNSKMAGFLIDVIQKTPKKKKEIMLIHKFLTQTKPEKINHGLLALIWIILFCKKE
jgi:MFS family permease